MVHEKGLRRSGSFYTTMNSRLVDASKAVLLLLSMFHVCLYNTVLSVPCSLVITCWERADLLALLCVTFPSVLCLGLSVVFDCIES